ncbi:MAG: sigma-70 family RNA polymerase sigma factor [Chloroflexi bacterium]|nr:sigma-70 family RNA polymerase sigma factor [Chloroflexota bacterium]
METTAAGTLPAVDFAQLYTSVFPKLAAMLKRQGAADGENMAQEAFCNAWRAWPRFVGGEREARSWLYRIGHNLLMDELRARSRHPSLFEGYGIAAALTENQIVARLDAVELLSSLAERRRVALVTNSMGYSVQEVADRMGLTYETAKMLIFRARTRMRISTQKGAAPPPESEGLPLAV